MKSRAIELIAQHSADLREITVDINKTVINVIVFRFPELTLYIKGDEILPNFLTVVRLVLGEPGRLLLRLINDSEEFTSKIRFIADIVPKRQKGWRVKPWGIYHGDD